MRQPAQCNRICQRLHQRILADHMLESGRPVFTGQNAVGL